MFLFNDLLMWTKEKENGRAKKYEWTKMCYLADTTFVPGNYGREPRPRVKLHTGGEMAISVLSSDHECTVLLKAETEEMTGDWFGLLLDNRSNFLENEQTSKGKTQLN